ncbi:hypothetical protein PsYK624_051350 [Phanerochaete sordida]|uniref:DUF6533 domain-containing protein n=1 Tax=Phanerochaete sordida TaxID=48140 RepID=A0A9P3G756_9APHY|nr:hypothetical protein PsYK624_051350 [Phanerochaete sordida]
MPSLVSMLAVSYSEVASVALLTWDIIITLSEEVELIWEKRWTPAKFMYLIARYMPWAFQIALLPLNIDGSTGIRFSFMACQRWMTVQAIVLQFIVTAVDVILIMRVYALYNRNLALLGVLSALFLAEVSALGYILAVITPELKFNHDCFVTASPPLFVAYWIVSLVFETVLFVLTLLKFAHAVRQGWGRRPVMRDFVSDGTWAYTLLFVTMLVNALLYKFVRSPLAGICFTWLLSVLSFAGSRLILNPRRRGTVRLSLRTRSPLSIPLSPLSPLTPLTPSIWVAPCSPGSPSSAGSPGGLSPSSPGGASPLKARDGRSAVFEGSAVYTESEDCGVAF